MNKGEDKGLAGTITFYFLEFYHPMLKYSASITESRDIAEDALQDVFETILNKPSMLRNKSDVKAYLYRSVKNRSLDIIRNEQSRSRLEKEFSFAHIEDPIHSTGRNDKFMLIRKVQKECENLPDKQRMVFILSKREGLTYSEISEYLKVPEKTVEDRMTRMLQTVRDRFLTKSQ